MNIELLKITTGFVAWDVAQKARRFRSLCQEIGINLTNKQFSEMLSGIVENSFERASEGFAVGMSSDFYYPDIIIPKIDSEPDMYFENLPLEIKTKFGRTGAWRGGAYSKRSSDYLFLAWEWVGSSLALFALHRYVPEEMWREGNTGNYYATRLDLEDIMPEGTILLGEAKLAKTRYHAIPVTTR